VGALDGRVAVITGPGAASGGNTRCYSPPKQAQTPDRRTRLFPKIVAAGGRAVADTENVAGRNGTKGLVEQAVSEFGRLDVVVNNAGILRDSFIPGMEESRWDAVIAVDLKGTSPPCDTPRSTGRRR
jgi:NAD(P)-dependent dehydrogenase (short-subunit alcohol dehydrogenase family)